MLNAQKDEEFPFCNAIGSIELQQASCRTSFWRQWMNVTRCLPFKMIIPNISARIE